MLYIKNSDCWGWEGKNRSFGEDMEAQRVSKVVNEGVTGLAESTDMVFCGLIGRSIIQ